MMKNKFSLVLFLSFIILKFSAQINVTDDDWIDGSVNGSCSCSTDFSDGSIINFFDSGSDTATYNPNENEIITVCPDSTGSKMRLAMLTDTANGYRLNIHPTDTLYIYDGSSVTAPLLAKINDSTYPSGINIPASWSNTSGCLTFQFISDASEEGLGWKSNLTCSNPKQPFSNRITAYVNGSSNGANDTINDMFPSDTGWVDICLGDVITFNAEPYFPYEPGGDSAALSGGGYIQSANFTTTWEVSDGSTYNTSSFQFTPTARNGYYIILKVEDSLTEFRYSFCKIRVSTIPNFSTCGPVDDPICIGRNYEIIGGVSSFDTAGVDPLSTNFPVGGVFAAQTYLPDGSGANYNTSIDISGYNSNSTIQNSNDIQRLCFKIEHSYLGDLEMKLTCPNGQNVNIFDSYSGTSGMFNGGFGGGSDFLGGAYDSNIGNIGYCEEYCFSNSASAMPAWVNGYNTTIATGPTAGDMVVPGLYQPEVDFVPALQGCPVNGTWTLTVRDNLGIDDGYICEWGIYFKDSLHPSYENYAPSIVSDYWQSDSTIISDLDTVIIVQPNIVGTNPYTFVVEDNYGCIYDTTINLNTQQGAKVLNDTVSCATDFQYDTILTPLGGSWFYSSNSGNLLFDDSTSPNPFVTVSQTGTYTIGLFDNFCNDTLTHEINFRDISSILNDTVTCGLSFEYDSIENDSINWFYYGNNGIITFDDSTSNNPFINASQSGIYTIGFSGDFCDDTISHQIEFKERFINSLNDTLICGNNFQYDSISISFNGNWFYFSNNGSITFNDNNSPNPNVTSSGSGFYFIGAYDNICNDTISHFVEFLNIPSPPNIYLNGDTLFSNMNNGNQWYNQDGIIANANNQFYKVQEDGDYYATLTIDGCISDSSNNINIVNSSTKYINYKNYVKAYPNPFRDVINIEIENNKSNTLELINSQGKILFESKINESKSIATTDINKGFYFIKIENEEGYSLIKIVKE